jgi:predicted nucleic acid-binding protein
VITAVDTNVLFDVLGADPDYGPASAEALRRCLRDGAVIACEVVWAETATAFPSPERFKRALRQLTIAFDPISEDAAMRAAATWRRYRSRGGARTRIAADFLIGAHAMSRAARLLTRDRGFYREYFSGCQVLDPSLR